jgi:hypothetical protein
MKNAVESLILELIHNIKNNSTSCAWTCGTRASDCIRTEILRPARAASWWPKRELLQHSSLVAAMSHLGSGLNENPLLVDFVYNLLGLDSLISCRLNALK